MKLTIGFNKNSIVAMERMKESLDHFTNFLKENPNNIEEITRLLKINIRVLTIILKTGIISKSQKNKKSLHF